MTKVSTIENTGSSTSNTIDPNPFNTTVFLEKNINGFYDLLVDTSKFIAEDPKAGEPLTTIEGMVKATSIGLVSAYMPFSIII